MAQELSNTQEQQIVQELKQTHSLNAQQVLMMRMLEMPLMQFEENVRTEMDENPALDGDGQDDSDFSDYSENSDYSDNSENSDSQESSEDERRDELREALGLREFPFRFEYNGTSIVHVGDKYWN